MKYMKDLDAEKYTYDTYQPGEANARVVAVTKEAADHPGTYNPVYICGPVGTGKSHLLRAMADRMQRAQPNAQIELVHCCDLVNQMISLIADGKPMEFRKYFTEVDAILVDDIQILAGKQTTQEEMRYLFDALVQSGKQVVLTADRPPREILALDDSLISRFRGGLLLELVPPDREARQEIVRQYAYRNWHQTLAPEVVAFLAGKISSVRSLQGAAAKLCAYTKTAGIPLPIEEVPDITKIYWDKTQLG